MRGCWGACAINASGVAAAAGVGAAGAAANAVGASLGLAAGLALALDPALALLSSVRGNIAQPDACRTRHSTANAAPNAGIHRNALRIDVTLFTLG